MHAVILDIDGTLLKTEEVDGMLYAAAVRQVLGNVRLRDSWGLYRNVTDSGILEQILLDNSLPADSGYLHTVREVFVDSVRRYVARHGPFAEIPGARRFVTDMLLSESHCVAYATGGWSASATFKLGSAGFPIDGVPLVSSDHFLDRHSIMLEAVNQLVGPFDSTTYYGDGEWDEVATRQLGWTFVPVGEKLGGLRSYDDVQTATRLKPADL